MKNIYQAILAQLEAQVPELKWIDLDKGQMNFERPPVLFPAALIDIDVVKAQNLNSRRQLCDAAINVKLCFDYGGNTDANTPTQARQDSLGYFDLKEKVYANLQGYGNAEMNGLERVREFSEPRRDHYKVINIVFTTQYRDHTADV